MPLATVPDMHMVLEKADKHMLLEEADKHMVLEEAVVPTAVQLGRAFQESCLRDVFFPRFKGNDYESI